MIELEKHQKVKLVLYVSHCLYAMLERGWEFSFLLFLTDAEPSTFFYVALAGVMKSLAQIVCMGRVGRWIDTTPRLFAVHTFILMKTFAILLALCFYFFLFTNMLDDLTFPASSFSNIFTKTNIENGLLYILTVLFALVNIGFRGYVICVEKDWVCVCVYCEYVSFLFLFSFSHIHIHMYRYQH